MNYIASQTTEQIEFVSFADLAIASDIHEQLMNNTIKYHKNSNEIEIKAYGLNRTGYFIDLCEIKNKSDLLQWVYHLTGKNWINVDIICALIERICKKKQWDIYE